MSTPNVKYGTTALSLALGSVFLGMQFVMKMDRPSIDSVLAERDHCRVDRHTIGHFSFLCVCLSVVVLVVLCVYGGRGRRVCLI